MKTETALRLQDRINREINGLQGMIDQLDDPEAASTIGGLKSGILILARSILRTNRILLDVTRAEAEPPEGLDRAIIAFWRDLSCFFVGQQRTAFVTLISKALEMWDALWTNGTRQALKISAETLSLMNEAPPPPPNAPTNPEPSGT